MSEKEITELNSVKRLKVALERRVQELIDAGKPSFAEMRASQEKIQALQIEVEKHISLEARLKIELNKCQGTIKSLSSRVLELEDSNSSMATLEKSLLKQLGDIVEMGDKQTCYGEIRSLYQKMISWSDGTEGDREKEGDCGRQLVLVGNQLSRLKDKSNFNNFINKLIGKQRCFENSTLIEELNELRRINISLKNRIDRFEEKPVKPVIPVMPKRVLVPPYHIPPDDLMDAKVCMHLRGELEKRDDLLRSQSVRLKALEMQLINNKNVK